MLSVFYGNVSPLFHLPVEHPVLLSASSNQNLILRAFLLHYGCSCQDFNLGRQVRQGKYSSLSIGAFAEKVNTPT